MKKMITVGAVVLAGLSLAACGNSKTESNNTSHHKTSKVISYKKGHKHHNKKHLDSSSSSRDPQTDKAQLNSNSTAKSSIKPDSKTATSHQENAQSQSSSPTSDNQSGNTTHQIVTYERIGGPQSTAGAGVDPQVNDRAFNEAMYNVGGATVQQRDNHFDNPSNQKMTDGQ